MVIFEFAIGAILAGSNTNRMLKRGDAFAALPRSVARRERAMRIKSELGPRCAT
jgi:hypothetical protein